MKQQEVLKKIGGIIKELNDQYEYLTADEEHLNDLELELFVANAHFLADHTEILRKINIQANSIPLPPPVAVPVEKKEATLKGSFFEPIVQLVKPEKKEERVENEEPEPERKPIKLEVTQQEPVPEIDLQIEDTTDQFSFIRQDEPGTIRHELILEEADTWEDEDEVETVKDDLAKSVAESTQEPAPISPVNDRLAKEPKTEQKTAAAEEPTSPAIAQQGKPLTINQRMSAQFSGHSGGVAVQVKDQPLSDLKSAITLNDKLLYVKDLFNGYNLAYSEVIDILNRFTNFEEAERYLKANYVVKNHWENKQTTAEKFYALLKRRYS